MRLPTLALPLLAALPFWAQTPPLPVRPEQLPPRTHLDFSPPALARETLPNGMRIILLPDRSLPLVHFNAVVKSGGVYDPPDKVGLAELTGDCLTTGGTRNHPADELNEALESLAAEVSSAISAEEGTVTLDILSKDMDVGLPLFAEILSAPAFAREKVEVERAKMLEALKRQNEEPFAVARREAQKALWGADSPWARTPTLKGVQALTRDDVAAFHAKYFHPNAVILAVSGDFEPKEMLGRLRALFKGWKSSPVDYPAVAAAPSESPSMTLLVDKGDLTQTTVLIGELSGRRFEGGRFNEDRYAMDVMNYILGGGGFNSTLMREIRSNRGLAYGAGSFYSFGSDRGAFLAYCQTGVATTGQVVGLIREALKRAVAAPPSEDDLRVAKESLLNSFIFNYQSPSRIANQAALYDYRAFPRDYLASYCDNIRKVAAGDVQRAAAKYLHPEKMLTFVLGPAKGLEGQLGEAVEIRPLPEP